MTPRDRHEHGLEVLRQVGGADYDGPINALSEIAPDLARFTVDFGYGDVMSRPGLDLRTRQLCTVAALAALAALGTAQPQLRYHIDGARNVGCSPDEIVETLLLVTVFAGFPAALNGVTAAREVFEQRGDSVAESHARVDGPADRYERGMRNLERISGGGGREVVERLADIAPDLGRFIVEFSYGDVIGRTGLDDRTKELATVAMCTALGTAQPQLAVHITAALNVGATRPEIVEAITQIAVYAGFPAALNAISTARNVFG